MGVIYWIYWLLSSIQHRGASEWISTKHLSFSSHGRVSWAYSYALEILTRRAKSRKMKVVGFARFMMAMVMATATVNHVEGPSVKPWGNKACELVSGCT